MKVILSYVFLQLISNILVIKVTNKANIPDDVIPSLGLPEGLDLSNLIINPLTSIHKNNIGNHMESNLKKNINLPSIFSGINQDYGHNFEKKVQDNKPREEYIELINKKNDETLKSLLRSAQSMERILLRKESEKHVK